MSKVEHSTVSKSRKGGWGGIRHPTQRWSLRGRIVTGRLHSAARCARSNVLRARRAAEHATGSRRLTWMKTEITGHISGR